MHKSVPWASVGVAATAAVIIAVPLTSAQTGSIGVTPTAPSSTGLPAPTTTPVPESSNQTLSSSPQPSPVGTPVKTDSFVTPIAPQQIEQITGVEDLVKNDGGAVTFFHPRPEFAATFFNLNKTGARVIYHIGENTEAGTPQVGLCTTVYGSQSIDAFQSDNMGQLRIISSSQPGKNSRNITRMLDVPPGITAMKTGPSTLDFRDEKSVLVGSIRNIRGYIGDLPLSQLEWVYENGSITFSTPQELGERSFLTMFEYSPFAEAVGIEGKTK